VRAGETSVEALQEKAEDVEKFLHPGGKNAMLEVDIDANCQGARKPLGRNIGCGTLI
jgi:hypothetical protein